MTSTLPSGVTRAGAVYDSTSGYVYIFGGYDGTAEVDTIYRFDPTGDTLTAITAILPDPRSNFWMGHDSANRLVYLAGGIIGGSEVDSIVQIDLSTIETSPDIVTIDATLPAARDNGSGGAQSTFVSSENAFYVLGGSLSGTPYDAIIEIDFG